MPFVIYVKILENIERKRTSVKFVIFVRESLTNVFWRDTIESEMKKSDENVREN